MELGFEDGDVVGKALGEEEGFILGLNVGEYVGVLVGAVHCKVRLAVGLCDGAGGVLAAADDGSRPIWLMGISNNAGLSTANFELGEIMNVDGDNIKSPEDKGKAIPNKQFGFNRL